MQFLSIKCKYDDGAPWTLTLYFGSHSQHYQPFFMFQITAGEEGDDECAVECPHLGAGGRDHGLASVPDYFLSFVSDISACAAPGWSQSLAPII